MKIEFQSVSKRYAYEWIFKKVNYTFEDGKSYGIIGPNGSGKSTFLKILLGTIDPSQGKVIFTTDKGVQPVDSVYQSFSFTAPYMDIPSNFTIKEIIKFHFAFRQPVPNIKPNDLIDIAILNKSITKEIRQYSSGMKQRLKLAIAICTESDVLVLDEPTTNLDEDGKEWFHNLLKKYLNNRILVIATNEKGDLKMCNNKVNILDYK